MPEQSPWFLALMGTLGVVAGAVASVSGFGIGSLLTPVLAIRVGTKLAVAAVSVPHLSATALRLWLLRKHVDRRLLWSFGLMSAAGGLAGALLHSWANSLVLTLVFGGLLVFTGAMGLSGLSQRLRFEGWVAWVAGGVSGALGGLVGNQGGIRSAAMLGFHVPQQAFVATATAVGVIVDAARMPVYLATEGHAVARLWPTLLATTAGCILGTLAGARLLKRIPEPMYRRIVSALVLILGAYMLFRAAFFPSRPGDRIARPHASGHTPSMWKKNAIKPADLEVCRHLGAASRSAHSRAWRRAREDPVKS